MSLYWADRIADRLAEASDGEPVTIATGITPSGHIHIGNMREEMTVDLVLKAMLSKNISGRYVHSWDDFDRLRKVPGDVPAEWEKYIGMPVSRVPDPWECHSSYAEHFEREFEEAAARLHVQPEFVRQSEKYQNCDYAEGIRTAMRSREEIVEILNRRRKEPLKDGWWPAEIYCEKCWRDSTEITDYDNEYAVFYRCECGHESEFDFRKVGNIKLKWRIDWPMRWAHERVRFEPGGKDHSAPGGSFDTAKEIVKIFGWEPPEYIMYDFVTPKGEGGKISSSKGNVVLPTDLLEIYLPEIVRYFYASTKPAKEFSIPMDEELLKVYEDFYHTERVYYGKEEEDNERRLEHLKRVYELSTVIQSEKIPEQLSPSSIIYFSQLSDADYVLKSKGLGSDRSREIVEKVRAWIGKYSPQYAIKLNEKPDTAGLDGGQIEALRILASELDREWDADSLQDRIYSLKDDVGSDAKGVFRALYTALISKPAGPKAGELIVDMIGRERVRDVLRQL